MLTKFFSSDKNYLFYNLYIANALRDSSLGLTPTCNVEAFLNRVADHLRKTQEEMVFNVHLWEKIHIKMSKAFWEDEKLTSSYKGVNGFGGYELEPYHFCTQTIQRFQTVPRYLHVELYLAVERRLGPFYYFFVRQSVSRRKVMDEYANYECYWYQSRAIAEDDDRSVFFRSIIHEECNSIVAGGELEPLLTAIADKVKLFHPGLRIKLAKAFWETRMLTYGSEGENGFGGDEVGDDACVVHTIRRYRHGDQYLHLEFYIVAK